MVGDLKLGHHDGISLIKEVVTLETAGPIDENFMAKVGVIIHLPARHNEFVWVPFFAIG